jgi:two-component system, OmpR family, phosphate regulon sensor histidine kinase PhoR
MNKFRNRLTLILVFFISLSNIAAGIFTIYVFRDSQIRSLEEGVRERLLLYSATVDWDEVSENSVGGAAFRSEAVRIARKLGAQVAFFDSDGNVLADSTPGGNSGNVLPPEIKQAASDGFGVNIRPSAGGTGNIMYAAVPASFGHSGVGFIRFGESMDHLDRETYRIIVYLALGLWTILAVTSLISYRISQGLTDPLEKISSVAHQITDRNYKARVDVASRDEVGQLGEAINAMAESLQIQMNRIQEDERRLKSVLENMLSGVAAIDRDERITLVNRSAEEILGVSASELLGQNYRILKAHHELVGMIGECRQKLEHIAEEMVFHYPAERTLEVHLVPMTGGHGENIGILLVFHDISAIRRLERMRSEFVSNVTHELKTPIAAVKGFAETLLGGAMKDPETAGAFLTIILEESERLDRLIGELLDLSRIESKRAKLQFSPIEVKTFLQRMESMMSTEAAKKGIALEVHADDGVYLEADEDRLQQIMINLLANGINYTQSGGWVKIFAEPIPVELHSETADGRAASDGTADNGMLRIVVQDNGIGIPKKDLPRIFERFYRVDKARTRASGGTGLGLSIVKHLVELHKGTIRVESAVGVGSRFIIELPVVQ